MFIKILIILLMAMPVYGYDKCDMVCKACHDERPKEKCKTKNN